MKMDGFGMQKSSNFAYFSYQHERILWWLHLLNFPLELDFFSLLWSKTFFCRILADVDACTHIFSTYTCVMYNVYVQISAHLLCILLVLRVYLTVFDKNKKCLIWIFMPNWYVHSFTDFRIGISFSSNCVKWDFLNNFQTLWWLGCFI